MAGSPLLRAFGKRTAERAPRDAVDQNRLKRWLERIGEHRFHLRLVWGINAGLVVILGISVAGNIYLGTLPKSVVEWQMLDPHGFPLKAYAKEVVSASQMQQVHELLITRFLKGLREVYPFDKEHQRAAMTAAARMTRERDPAWKKGKAYFDETQPYERQKKEGATIDVTFSFQENPTTWRMTFCEEVRQLNTAGVARAAEYNATVFVELDDSRKAQKATPLGLFVHDYHISDGKPVQSCAR